MRNKWMGTCAAALVAAVVLTGGGAVRAQMPDMRSMSGTPLPTGDLPVGSVAVRVVRESIANNVPGQVVELKVGSEIRKATTDAEGRAVFAGLTPGTTVQAHAILGDEHIDSQEFTVPPQGGVRVMLVAGLGAAAPAEGAPQAPQAPAATGAVPPAPPGLPAQPGTVVLGGQSRFIIELNDGSIDVYNLFEIVNSSGAPVETAPLVFQFPEGSRGATLFDGATPQARLEGTRVVVSGPFAPGVTSLPMAYQLPYTTGALEFAQVLPADLNAMSVLANSSVGSRFASPQVADTRNVTVDNKPFIAGNGGRVAAGTPIAFALDGLPYHSQVGRFLSLGIVVLLLGVGAWLAVNGEDSTFAADRQRAMQKRDKLLRELAELERHRQASLDPRLDVKREGLIAQLEKVYRQIDHLGGTDPGQAGIVAGGGLAPTPR